MQSNDLIVHSHVAPGGRILLITRRGADCRLLELTEHGPASSLPLFNGAPGARFAFFQNALERPGPQPPQDSAICLSWRSAQTASAFFLERRSSEHFQHQTVFVATPQALYRLAGGHILRGEIRQGHFLEEVIASAHRRQTKVWASPHADRLLVHHRIWDQNEFFLLDERRRHFTVTLATPPSLPTRRIMDSEVAWGHATCRFALA